MVLDARFGLLLHLLTTLQAQTFAAASDSCPASSRSVVVALAEVFAKTGFANKPTCPKRKAEE